MSVKKSKPVSTVNNRMLHVLIESAINNDSKTARQTINKIVKYKLGTRVSKIAKALNK